MKKQLTDKERIHREEQSIKIDEKDFDLIPVSVCFRLFFEKKTENFFQSRSIWRDEAKKYGDENPETNQTSFWGDEERFSSSSF